MPPTHPDLIGTAAVAVILDCSVSTVQRLVEVGELQPATKLPGLRGPYLFDRSDVEALLAPEQAS